MRLRWRVWTSRRFCDNCSPQFGNTLRLQRALMAAGLIVFGILIGGGFRREPPPLVIQRAATAPTQTETSTQPPVTIEQTYTCGARTKKGTPCSRRVHGPVRCWQHKGAKPMLPLEKLVVKE